MYAVIATGGKQYKVSEGDVIRVEKLGKNEGDKVSFDQVLLVGGDETKVGNPTVSGASVDASITVTSSTAATSVSLMLFSVVCALTSSLLSVLFVSSTNIFILL